MCVISPWNLNRCMLPIHTNKQAEPVHLQQTISLPLLLFLGRNGNVFIFKEASCQVNTFKCVPLPVLGVAAGAICEWAQIIRTHLQKSWLIILSIFSKRKWHLVQRYLIFYIYIYTNNKNKFRKLLQINSLLKLIYYFQDGQLIKDMVAFPLPWHLVIQSGSLPGRCTLVTHRILGSSADCMKT